METHQDKHLTAIRRHAKLITACDAEFGTNLNSIKNVQVTLRVGLPQAARMVALEAVRMYAQAAAQYSAGEQRGGGVRVLPDAQMARVMAVCAAHVAFEKLGFERD